MALPPIGTFCVALTAPVPLCITMPGGARICATVQSGIVPTPDEMANAVLGQLSPAMAPLTPFFDVLNVLIALVDCMKAVEQCLGPPPNPTKLVQCFPKLEAAIAKLLGIVPQLSVPIMIGEALDALIAFLTGLKAQISAMITKSLQILIAQALAQALNSFQLAQAAECASADLAIAAANRVNGMAVVGEILVLINSFLDLLGLPEIGPPAAIGTNPSQALVPLTETIQVLTAVRKAFPL